MAGQQPVTNQATYDPLTFMISAPTDPRHRGHKGTFGGDLPDAELGLPDAGAFILDKTKDVVAILIRSFSVEHLSESPVSMNRRGPAERPLFDVPIRQLTVARPPGPARRLRPMGAYQD